jgi:diguanylate cyclase (GGDEF)-like protein/PAS domain S-box-containing protein
MSAVPDHRPTAPSGITGHFRTLLERSGDLSFLLSRAGHVRYANPTIQRVLGHRVLGIRGTPFAQLLHPTDAGPVLAVLGSFGDGGEPTPIGEARLRHEDGSFRWFDLVASDLLSHSGIEGILVEARDTTDRRRAEDALRAREERYALAALGANDGLWDWDLLRGSAYFSGRWRAMLGCRDHEVVGRIEEWTARIAPEDRPHVMAEIEAHVKGQSAHFENEHRLLRPDGRHLWVLMRGLVVRDAAGLPVRMAGSCTDITRRKRAEEELQQAALRDVLTGLANRAVLQERLERRLAGSRTRPGDRFALLYLDLDDFKTVNDGLGHLAGDTMLIEVGRRLSACVRPLDIVCRLGGDEFCILLEAITGAEDALRAAERVTAALREPMEVAGAEVFAGTSVGIALGPGDYHTPEEMLRDADTALYRAKGEGRGGCRLFDAEMHARVVAQLQLESDLRRAWDRGEFDVHFQPVIDVSTGGIAGFEALARWRHPTRGLVMPDGFLASLEEMNLLPELDRLVLRRSLAHAARWAGDGAGPWVSVNISPRQLQRPNFLAMVKEALAEVPLPPGALKLEITESALMGHGEGTVRLMRELSALGVEFFLDDFGTGYSSLSYLHRLPIQALKIDRSFTAELGTSRAVPPVIQAIFHLALGLDLLLIAEGVETGAQSAALLHLGCRFQQGHHLSRPLEPDAADLAVSEVRRAAAPAWRNGQMPAVPLP